MRRRGEQIEGHIIEGYTLSSSNRKLLTERLMVCGYVSLRSFRGHAGLKYGGRS
jgi:hypothetical protein